MTPGRLLALAALPLVLRGGGPHTLVLTSEAGAAMHALWDASVAAGAEQVACLSSAIEGDTLRIIRIQALAGGADSLGVPAQASLDGCGPPDWQGTVHTHIALGADRIPYGRFSGADRGVMLMWWQRWKTDGTFCLLFARDKAHCEIDGSRLVILPSATY